MVGLHPKAGAASPCLESGPGASISQEPAFEASPIVGLIAPSMPSASARFRGVALRLTAEAEGDEFEIVAVGERGETLMRLGRYSDEDVVATWRSLGASSGLPLMMERADGALHSAYAQIGRLQLGEVRIRRRHGLLNGRRPRFLTRRKTGRLPIRPEIHRESEIIGGSRG
jgi:hypothetical protein